MKRQHLFGLFAIGAFLGVFWWIFFSGSKPAEVMNLPESAATAAPTSTAEATHPVEIREEAIPDGPVMEVNPSQQEVEAKWSMFPKNEGTCERLVELQEIAEEVEDQINHRISAELLMGLTEFNNYALPDARTRVGKFRVSDTLEKRLEGVTVLKGQLLVIDEYLQELLDKDWDPGVAWLSLQLDERVMEALADGVPLNQVQRGEMHWVVVDNINYYPDDVVASVAKVGIRSGRILEGCDLPQN